MTWESVDLPEPFGPMIACTSPLFTVSVSPWRISRSSTRTCRFFTSSNAIISTSVCLLVSRERQPRASRRPASADAALQRDRDQFLRFDRELHRELLQHVLDEAVDDEADSLLLAQATLNAVEQHVLG